MSGKYFASLAIFWAATLGLMLPAAAQTPDTVDSDALTMDSDPVEHRSPQLDDSTQVLLILGLRQEANQLVRISVAEEFSGVQVESVDADIAASPDYAWPEADVYLAAGTRGCQVALEILERQRIMCTLLTEEGFLSLNTTKTDQGQLSALVIDQPVSRQARVAARMYPSLARFASFANAEPSTDGHEHPITVDSFSYSTARSLPSQLSDALSSHDALIATPDTSIYNSSTLSTVLLTAYGYHKPVIGFSRAYVKAGALITCYSTPSQVLREVAQMLDSGSIFSESESTINYPRYFSVVDNTNVAKSLGLIRDSRIVPGQTLSDEDFNQ